MPASIDPTERKTASPMCVRLTGRSMLRSFEQCAKAYMPISVTPAGRMTAVRPVQNSNAIAPIVVRLPSGK